MPKPELLQSALLYARTATVEMFEQRWPGHFLLGQWPRTGGGDKRRIEFTTGVINIEREEVRQAARENRVDGRGEISSYAPGLTFLHEVKKAARNTWLEWVSVGRAGNNDVILRHPSVSKLHARIHVEGERDLSGVVVGEYRVTDVKSTYGTRLNNAAIEPSRPYPLKSGDFLRFGQVGCFFLDAAGLYRRLRTLS
jgi:pSer/pThr/pTyr-binding forkhead associated (FHA) protein